MDPESCGDQSRLHPTQPLRAGFSTPSVRSVRTRRLGHINGLQPV